MGLGLQPSGGHQWWWPGAGLLSRCLRGQTEAAGTNTRTGGPAVSWPCVPPLSASLVASLPSWDGQAPWDCLLDRAHLHQGLMFETEVAPHVFGL